ncbi:hypothetical protein ACFLXN_00310 [Chloroflexota bacterium]
MLQRTGLALIVIGIVISAVFGIYMLFRYSFTSIPLPLQIAIIVFAVGLIAVLAALIREKCKDIKKAKGEKKDDHRYYGSD